MTLVEDAFEEILAEFGRTFIHVPHGGYDDETDASDFWHEDQGYNTQEDSTEFTGLMVSTEEQGDLAEAGFAEDSEFVVRTDYSELEDGDLVIHRERNWVVNAIDRREIQGREFAYRVGLVSQSR